MGSSPSRSVELEISNKTQNITLMKPRTFFLCGHCSKPLLPELSPGSSGTWHFSGVTETHWGLAGTTDVSGILVYEAKSFTLAIYFYNPSDHDKSSLELGLELSPGKAHLGDPASAYRRMAKGIYSSSDQDIKFARVMVDKNLETAWLSHGNIKVMAAMFPETSSRIKVVLEEE